MRRLGWIGTTVALLVGALWAAGQVLARRRTVGDATSDEFELAVYFGGAERASTAGSLRRGVVRVCCGGVDLDLRGAVLDPGGATLELSPLCGGVNVRVPRTWRVIVDDRSTLGGVDARVTPHAELPDDAPVLRVAASARLGGVALKAADPPSEHGHRLRGWAST